MRKLAAGGHIPGCPDIGDRCFPERIGFYASIAAYRNIEAAQPGAFCRRPAPDSDKDLVCLEFEHFAAVPGTAGVGDNSLRFAFMGSCNICNVRRRYKFYPCAFEPPHNRCPHMAVAM